MMSKNNSAFVIENENLFRLLICAPAAVAFAGLSINAITDSGLGILNLFFLLLTLYFSLSALGYAAIYTNERFEGRAAPMIKNQNLSKTIICLPLAVLFVALTLYSVSMSSSLFFNVVYGALAGFFVLATLGYASHYTNDYFEHSDMQPEH